MFSVSIVSTRPTILSRPALVAYAIPVSFGEVVYGAEVRVDAGLMWDSGRDVVGIAARVGSGLAADCELDSTGEDHAPLVSVRMFGNTEFDSRLVEQDLPGIA